MSGIVIDGTDAGVDVIADVDDDAVHVVHTQPDGDEGAVLPKDKIASES